MIAGIFHEGSGLGDQLFRYITVRTLAEAKGFNWAMLHGQNFKGSDFMQLPFGKSVPIDDFVQFMEKDVRENGIDIRSYDPEINFIEDNTIIDGSFEDSKYWHHNMRNISKWLAVEPLNVPDDTCIIGFRGGEYATQPDLFLSKDYWRAAINKMAFLGVTSFEIHTDDPSLAESIFKELIHEEHQGTLAYKVIDNQPISHSKHTNMGLNWCSARYAKYSIIPNSAFFILPRLLKHLEDPTAVTIAPRYWARRNTKTWARPACYYKEFTYI